MQGQVRLEHLSKTYRTRQRKGSLSEYQAVS